MAETKLDLDERLESEIRAHLGRYVAYYDGLGSRTGGLDLLELELGENRIIDRNLLAAYLSLRAERRAEDQSKAAAKDNKRLQIVVGIFAAISALGTIIQALVAAHAIA
jgi:hypothetical protein